MSTSSPSSSSSSSLAPSSASQETSSSIPPENANPAAAEQIFSTGNRWADYKLAAKVRKEIIKTREKKGFSYLTIVEPDILL